MHFTTMPMVIFFHSSSFVHCQLFQLADVVSQSSIIVSANIAQLKVPPKSLFRYFLCPLQVCFPLVISLQNNFFSKCLLPNCGRHSPYPTVIGMVAHIPFSLSGWPSTKIKQLCSSVGAQLTPLQELLYFLFLYYLFTFLQGMTRGAPARGFSQQKEQNYLGYARSDLFSGQEMQTTIKTDLKC